MVTQPPKPCAQRKRFTDKRPQRTDMANMNDLHAVGLNPFGVQLVAESLLKSPLAPMTADKPVTMFFPVQRSDCAGWAGVRFTFEAVRAPCECQQGTCESKTGRHCRMADEVKPGSGAQ